MAIEIFRQCFGGTGTAIAYICGLLGLCSGLVLAVASMVATFMGCLVAVLVGVDVWRMVFWHFNFDNAGAIPAEVYVSS